MKIAKLLTVLLFGAVVACANVASAADLTPTELAVALASNKAVSMERICLATADAVKNDTLAPSEVLSRVLASRQTWTTEQVAGLYKSVLLASPSLSSSFVSDVKAFEAAGKPTAVGAEATEGVKLLAALYASQISGVNADSVLASVVSGVTGPSMVRSVAPLRDVSPRPVAPRRPQPTSPTPGPLSPEN